MKTPRIKILAAALIVAAVCAMPSSAERYVAAAVRAGCPADQLRNFSRAGIVLQERQLAFAAAARLCDRLDGPTEVALGGARMGGKSHAMLAQVGADDCMRFPNLKCLFLRKVGTSGKESFEALLPKTIGRLGTYIPSQSLFRFPHNGSWIKLGHFQCERDVDKYLGLEYDVVAIEEATTLSHSKERAAMSCCRSPAGCGFRARGYKSTNPGGVGHAWFKSTFVVPFRRKAQSSTRFIPSTVDDNAFATPEYRAFLDGLQGWLLRAWRYGDWDIAAGQFFTNFSVAIHVVPARPIPPHWRLWMAIDYGWVHYTVVYLFGQDDDGNVFVLAEHAERRWLPDQHAAAIDAMLERLGVPPYRIETFLGGGDMFSPHQDGKTTADDYRACGYKLVQANTDRVNGAAEIVRRLGCTAATPAIGPRLFISEDCPRLIECLPALESSAIRPQDVQKVDCDPDGLGGDDPYDACRYGVMHAAAPSRRATFGADPFEAVRWGA